jgi:hypothetical protein
LWKWTDVDCAWPWGTRDRTAGPASRVWVECSRT